MDARELDRGDVLSYAIDPSASYEQYFSDFYFHDKNILAGAAYETAAVAGTKIREKEKTDAAQIEALFYERTEGKCILFPTPEVSIEIGDREIIVTAAARRGEFGLSVEKKIPVTEPEKTIRDRKRLKEIGNGTKNYN